MSLMERVKNKRDINRKLIMLLVFPIIALSLVLVAMAHSGKTDGNGGHTDHSTGEYHYHHGYPAHDHYDMDGDGDLDCPYEFDDKTGESSGSSYSYSWTQEETKIVEKIVEKEVPYTPEWVPWVVTLLSLTVIALIFYCIGKHQVVRDSEKENQKSKEILNMLNTDLIDCFGHDYLCTICNIPKDSYIGNDLLPHTIMSINSNSPDKYTLFLGGNSIYQSSGKYHRKGCRYCNYFRQINAYTISQDKIYSPCKVCSPEVPDVKWVDKYRKYYNLMKEDESK